MGDFLEIPENARRARASILFRDRFIRVVFGVGAEVTLEDAQDCIRIGQELHGHDPAPVTVDLRQCRSLSAEARAYFAGPGGVSLAPAVAIVISSPLSRAIGNFYLGFNRPKVPTRLFTNYTAAESWLDGFLQRRVA